MKPTFDAVAYVRSLAPTTAIVKLFGRQLHALSDELMDALARLNKLTKLWLDHNDLTEVPTGLGKLTNLVELRLEHNNLRTIPAELSQLRSLTILNLSHNQLTELPSKLRRLKALSILELDHNQFTQVPKVLLKLAGLSKLTLAGNPLPSPLPHQLARLVNLTDSADLSPADSAVPDSSIPDDRPPIPALPQVETLGDLLAAIHEGFQLHAAILVEVFADMLVVRDAHRRYEQNIDIVRPLNWEGWMEEYGDELLDSKFLVVGANVPPTGSTAVTIGRSHRCDVQLIDSSVSKVHARIVFDAVSARFYIKDEESRHGTRFHRHFLEHDWPEEVWSGACLSFGDVHLVFLEPAVVSKLSEVIIVV